MSCIQLLSIKYSEQLGTPNEWVLNHTPLNRINLIVGKNATGKSRTINVIAGLARLLTATPKFMVDNSSYDVLFDKDGEKLRYKVIIKDGKVMAEEYYIGDKNVLRRSHDGESNIEMHSPNSVSKMVQFSPPENELAVVIRRDKIQHPYLEILHQWAQATRHYTFGTPLGRESLAIIVKDAPDVDDRDTNQVVGIFRKAQREYGDKFIESIKQDMTKMRYEINSVEITAPKNYKILNSTTELTCIGIKEEGLERIIDQTEMSQGMFRALSILIQVNYSQMANRASCILIDDIGEGLDFERSTQLIDILRQKAANSSFQLIMTTNDRFVMNNVPLNEWLVLQRKGGNVSVRNYDNSKELFDEFKFTGLSNFSFLEMDFLNNNETTEIDA
jgi:AAA15 family ATPase/GTPase